MRAAEVVASRILFWGGVLSILLMALGLVGFAARGGGLTEWGPPVREPAHPPAVYTSAGQVARALSRWPVEPLAVVAAGILLLMVTPFVGIVAVFVVFAAAGDRRYAGIAALLIAALLVSLAFVH